MVIEAGVVAGYLIAWAIRKARRVGGRLDRESDAIIDVGLDRLHEVVAAKLGGHPALVELVEEAEAAGDGGQVDADVCQQVELALKVAARKDDLFGHLVTELVAQLRAAEEAAGRPVTAGPGSAVFTGNVDVRADRGGVAVGQVAGDLHIGPTPETVRRMTQEQRRMRTEQRQLRAGVEEMVDRARQDQADRDGGQVRVAPPVIAYPVPAPPPADDVASARAQPWHGGAEVWIGDRRYLLHDGLLAERADPGYSVLLREARARQLIPAPTHGGYVWLRQAGPAHGNGNAAVLAARKALERERSLLEQAPRLEAVPRVAQLAAGGGRTTLAVTWPSAKDGAPSPTLRASFPLDAPPDAWHLSLLLSGIGRIAAALSALHARGVTHRNLTPDAIIVTGDGRFALRDLGLAGHPTRPGEGPPGYQAPEQQPGGGTAGPGPATDVWQLAAITYQLLTGHRPALRRPAPADALNQEVPPTMSDLLSRALEARPADRPAMSQFRPAQR